MDQIVDRPEQGAKEQPIEAALGLDRTGRSKRRLRLVWVLLAVAAVAAAGFYYLNMRSQAPAAISYVSIPARKDDLVVKVSATGTLQPVTQTDVSSELSGIVRTVGVVENERVAKGQVLAVLDTARLSAQVERAGASVKAAEAQLNDTQVTLRETEQTLARSRSLSDRGMLAQQALEAALAARDRAAASVETAQANLAVARADLKLQEADLTKSTIRAPIDGIVLTRDVDPGQTVASSMQAPILFVIAANLEKMELEAAIDEADIGTVEIGQKAHFTVDAFPGRSFDAAIRDIAYAAVTTEGVVTYEAKLTVANDDLALRPGMTATVDVITREANDVLTIPSAAFRYRPPAPEAQQGGGWSLERLFMPRFGGRRQRMDQQRPGEDGSRTLYVLEDGQAVVRQVKTGSSDGDMTEIVSGLNEGERVIVGQNTGQGRDAGGSRAGSRPRSASVPAH